jgi:RES domain
MSPAARAPIINTVAAGAAWWRIHRDADDPLFFGAAFRRPASQRFDAPDGEFRVAYFGATREASFAEVFLRVPPVYVVTMSELRIRRLSRITVTRPVQLVELHGPGLARVGISGTASAGADYQISRRAAIELWQRPEQYDGLVYRARHDDDELSIALYDRAAGAVTVAETLRLADDARWLRSLALRYGFEFSP